VHYLEIHAVPAASIQHGQGRQLFGVKKTYAVVLRHSLQIRYVQRAKQSQQLAAYVQRVLVRQQSSRIHQSG